MLVQGAITAGDMLGVLPARSANLLNAAFGALSVSVLHLVAFAATRHTAISMFLSLSFGFSELGENPSFVWWTLPGKTRF